MLRRNAPVRAVDLPTAQPIFLYVGTIPDKLERYGDERSETRPPKVPPGRSSVEMPASGLVVLASLAAFMGPFIQTVCTPILPDLEQSLYTSEFVAT